MKTRTMESVIEIVFDDTHRLYLFDDCIQVHIREHTNNIWQTIAVPLEEAFHRLWTGDRPLPTDGDGTEEKCRECSTVAQRETQYERVRRHRERQRIKDARAKFRRVHRLMAGLGMCNGTGGVEFQRVLREWEDEDMPTDIVTFIYEHSNGVGVEDASTWDNLDHVRRKLAEQEETRNQRDGE